MYELIASAFLGNYILVRPGCRNGMKISYVRYKERTQAVPDDISPAWLAAVARRSVRTRRQLPPLVAALQARPGRDAQDLTRMAQQTASARA